MISAPLSIAAFATSHFVVSIEMGMSKRCAIASTTDNVRCTSTSGSTDALPGRVDSPPTSMISTPSAIICSARLMASSAERNSPPSEKLSGVTFRMPITSGRSSEMRRRDVCHSAIRILPAKNAKGRERKNLFSRPFAYFAGY